ncbi:hypothetical protein [Halobacillus andaensis]|uniref:hypothetical protein n=1 Tax=Halobacillus andaensis TaxID=1176239 RepID=UPI003D71C448
MANLQIGLEEIPYQLTRSEDYPFLKIYLDDLNGIYVSAPVRKTQQEIEGFLMKKSSGSTKSGKNSTMTYISKPPRRKKRLCI